MSKNNWDSDWVHFSKKSRRGILVLLILFVLIAVAPRLYHNYVYTPPNYNVKYSAIVDNPSDSSIVKETRYRQPDVSFDPNVYTLEEWKSVGLTEKQAQSILKYLGSGAQLRVKSDLKKLYVIDDELYSLLEPKLNLPDSIEGKKSQSKPTYNTDYDKTQGLEEERDEIGEETVELAPMSINHASSRELQTIPGIGPFFAKEILKIRENYGGFISSDQLLDIYRMDEEKLSEILPYLIIDPNEVNKLNVNTASEEQLRKHPLISRDMAKSIVYFRKNHKEYDSLNDLLLSPYIDGQVLKTIMPYLKVE